MIASRIHEIHEAFKDLSTRERDTAINFLLGFCVGYVPDEKWPGFVAESRQAAIASRPAPKPSGKDAAAGPDK